MSSEEEIDAEVEAMEAVYESDCLVLKRLPPELHVTLTPHTAEDTSVQFVGVVLVMRAGEKYPMVPPELELKDARGLDDRRHAELLSNLRAQAADLSGSPMLLALCEAAKDLLTNMNFPDGECCFCRSPMMMESCSGHRLFFKLRSCFHCFHCDCFGRWLKWCQAQVMETYVENEHRQDAASISLLGVPCANTREPPILCPVCRAVLSVDDIAHVLNSETMDVPKADEDEDLQSVSTLLRSEEELARKAQFAAQFESQQARGGIIELKKLECTLLSQLKSNDQSKLSSEGGIRRCEVLPQCFTFH